MSPQHAYEKNGGAKIQSAPVYGQRIKLQAKRIDCFLVEICKK